MASMNGFRPLSGNSLIAFSSMTPPRSAEAVSRIGTSSVTVTDWATSPRSSATLTVEAWPTLSVMPCRTARLNPACSAESS
jgi:hypothetical protein